MDKVEFKKELFDKVQTIRNVSFVEISRMSGAKGDNTKTLHTPKGPAVLWIGLSKLALDCIDELIDEKKIEAVPADYLTYYADGNVLKLPLFTNRKAKRDRWMPVVFNPYYSIPRV